MNIFLKFVSHNRNNESTTGSNITVDDANGYGNRTVNCTLCTCGH